LVTFGSGNKLALLTRKNMNMKTLKVLFSFLLLSFATISFAQTKTESFKVAGECGMCKKKIEKAATTAGASFAEWNTESKMLTVNFASTSANKAKIEEAIASAGYDTPGVKATDEAYKGLAECCQYERTAGKAQTCCDSEKCTQSACMNDGKCTKDATCCKETGCDKKDCCKKA
jgi:periplasmic mercuric ion binding protein